MKLEILQVCCCENGDGVKQTFGPVGKVFDFMPGDKTFSRLLDMEKDGKPVAKTIGRQRKSAEKDGTA